MIYAWINLIFIIYKITSDKILVYAPNILQLKLKYLSKLRILNFKNIKKIYYIHSYKY